MERMGWQKGKGLGAREDGITDHVKIKFKDDTKGVGFDNKGYENVWLDHQDNFEDLLSQLKKENGIGEACEGEKTTGDEIVSPAVIKSLEEKSKMSRARVHYRKFTRSKDLTNASENDLDCILGRQKRIQLKQSVADEVPEENSQEAKKNGAAEDEIKSSTSDAALPESTFRTINTGMSIGDYFASKMAELKKRRLDDTVGDCVEENGLEKKKKKKSKKGKDELEPEQILVAEETLVEEDGDGKKKKKKSKKEKIESEQVIETFEETEVLPVDGIEEVEKKKKKKSKKEKKEKKEHEPVEKPVEEQNGSEHQVELNGEEKKKKKKKSKSDNEKKDEKQNGKQRKEKDAIHSCFQGSNLFQLNGYTPYPVTKDVEAILNEKYRKVDKKRSMLARKLAEDPSAYEMKKMPEVNLNTVK